MEAEFKSSQHFVPPLVAFSWNGKNLTFCLKRVVFNHFSLYFQQYKCLFISPIAFIITFRQILIFKKSCNIVVYFWVVGRHGLGFLAVVWQAGSRVSPWHISPGNICWLAGKREARKVVERKDENVKWKGKKFDNEQRIFFFCLSLFETTEICLSVPKWKFLPRKWAFHTGKKKMGKDSSYATSSWLGYFLSWMSFGTNQNSNVVQTLRGYVGWWCNALRGPMPSFVQECDCMSHNIDQVDFGLTWSKSWSLGTLKA